MSGLLLNVHEELSMPGGVGFVDATDILEKGTEDMQFGTLLSVDGFTLNDAMSALEIMDPRMDTGMTEPPPPFDPHMPLLPSEVCWILDRSFACEMSWHAGLALSQTVYTLQYVHHLADISSPRFKAGPTTRSPYEPVDPDRPIELVTLVLRAGVFGLLKCCDMVWRELANDQLTDGEDWNSEKFGVSLCEGVQPNTLMLLLDEAITWLRTSPLLSSSPWRVPLMQRLLMRKNIFQSLSYPSFPALQTAEQNLDAILAGPSPPEPSATVKKVFDPAISRQLVSFVPTRAVDLPPQAETWEAIAMWLDRWQEVRRLVDAESLMSVRVLASLRAYEGQSPRRSAFLRALSISTFFNGSKILHTHEPPWLVDRFFWELAAIEPGTLSRLAAQSSEGSSDTSSASSLDDGEVTSQRDAGHIVSNGRIEEAVELFEKALAKLLVDYFSSFFHNRPRQRRGLVDSLLVWHLALEHASDIATRLSAASSPDLSLSRVPLCIRHARVSIITEIIFSGFELQLYARDEWAMMYWYVEHVLNAQMAVLGELEVSLSQEHDRADTHQALVYVSVQQEYTEALRCFASAMRDVLQQYAPSKANASASREQVNFEKRFKWAFTTGYSEAMALDEDKPILGKWRRWRNEYKSRDGWADEAVHNLIRAQDAFSRLAEREPAETAAVFCQGAFKKFILGLKLTCQTNLGFLQKPLEVRGASRPKWIWNTSQWFPDMLDSSLVA